MPSKHTGLAQPREGAHPTVPVNNEGASGTSLAVVIPAYQEGDHVAGVIESIRDVLDATQWEYTLVVVDDGSTDDTAVNAEAVGATVVRHRQNRGYGASLKHGIRSTPGEWILIIDADGTYPASSIPDLLALADDCDMVVGARTGPVNYTPLLRRPAKWFLRRLASYLAGRRLPDLNSGLRLMRRSLVERYESLLPGGFSFTTTITLAATCNDHPVEFVEIPYQKRLGRSSIRPWHAFDFLLLVLRTVIFFNPLRVFIPLGAVPAAVGLAKLVYDLTQRNISESAVFALLAALIIWSVGLLADQNSRIAMRL